jgi:hypothetical protein
MRWLSGAIQDDVLTTNNVQCHQDIARFSVHVFLLELWWVQQA